MRKRTVSQLRPYAESIAETWVNGNREEAFGMLFKQTRRDQAILLILLMETLNADDRDFFVRRLEAI